MHKLLLSIFTLAFTLSAEAGPAGTVTHLSGVLSVKRDGVSKVLAVRSEVQPGDLLSTEHETYARIKFTDNSEVVLRPNTQFRIENYAYNEAKPQNDGAVFSMLRGGLRAVTGLIGKRNHDKINFTTSTATIGIRGTHWGMLLCANDCGSVHTPTGRPLPDGLHTDVASGAIVVKNGAGEIQLNAGQFGFVAGPNVPPVTVPPQDGVRVTMPSSISQNQGSGGGIGKGKEGECAL